MKITKNYLRKIIKETIENEISYPKDINNFIEYVNNLYKFVDGTSNALWQSLKQNPNNQKLLNVVDPEINEIKNLKDRLKVNINYYSENPQNLDREKKTLTRILDRLNTAGVQLPLDI